MTHMYNLLNDFQPLDLHPVISSLSNLFMYAQIQGENEIMKFYNEGWFTLLL